MNYNNYGANGSTVSNFVTTNNPMVLRYTAMSANDADIIVLQGGKNDFNNSVPIGTNEDTETTTFKGALKYLITKLREKYPNAMIVCVPVWNAAGTNSIGNTVVDYGIAMKEVATQMNVPFFESYDSEISGVNMTSSAFRTTFSLTPTDVSHLNKLGHKMFCRRIEAFIAEQYSIFIENAG